MDTTAVFLANIPNNKSKSELSKEFRRIWPDVFKDDVNFEIQLFSGTSKQGYPTTKCVVTGIHADFDQMESTGRTNRIFNQRIIIKRDIGEPRNSDGSFKNPKKGIEARKDAERIGSTQRKVAAVFNAEFLSSIGFYRLRLSDRKLLISPIQVPSSLLSNSGDYRQLEHESLLSLQYTTVIGAMQAVATLNGLNIKGQIVSFFSTQTSLPLSNPLKGLGIDGILDTDVFNRCNYLPFTAFNPSILDWEKIRNGIKSLCWRCNEPYKFIGMDINLNYLAGVCTCSYGQDNTDKKAYKWARDKDFTRLVVDGKRHEARDLNEVTILHEPMKSSYSSSQEYARLVLPILQEEWMYSSKCFREAYFCVGRVSFFNHTETTEINEKMKDIYAVEVIIPRNPVWNEHSSKAVKHLTLLMTIMHENRHRQDDVAGRLYQIKPKGRNELTLCLRVLLPVGISPSDKHRTVEVKPRPDKSEYKTTTSLIRKWSQTGTREEIKESSRLDVNVDHPYLESLMARKTINWNLKPTLKSHVDADLDRVMSEINVNLNHNQLLAKKKAVTHNMSYIQGPPGTGKTQVAAAIVLSISIKEPGMIVVTAASNEACNGLADRIWSMSQQLGITPSVVRVMAPSKEEWGQNDMSQKHVYPQLDDLVKLHGKFDDNRHQNMLHLLSEKNEHRMTELEKKSFDVHVECIEQEILKTFDIAVCTIGSIADRRVVIASKQIKVSTLLIEEAGQMTQPQSLPILLLKPRRIVLIGDHQQLPPTVQSRSAARAGLDNSPLLLAASNYGKREDQLNENNPGWTTLTEQHRMVSPIRELVSDMTYNGILTDAPIIFSRDIEILPQYLRFIPELRKHAILLMDERGHETQVGTSYKNINEAIRVAQTVTKLLMGQTPPHKITVLSFYEAQKKEISIQMDLEQKHHPSITGYSDVRVANVDAYQGRENSLVIVSFVRSNAAGDIGFAREPNRINVALSRARTHLVIVCNLHMFENYKSEVWTSFTKKVKELANII